MCHIATFLLCIHCNTKVIAAEKSQNKKESEIKHQQKQNTDYTIHN